MSLTRRSLLRDTALLSLAGAAGASPLLLGCNKDERSHFACGVRIFFEGAWFFAGEPNHPDRMRAFSLNPPELDPQPTLPSGMLPAKMGHNFPYGSWSPKIDFDKSTSLPANPYTEDTAENRAAGRAKMVIPHEVYVVGTHNPVFNLDQLFTEANVNSSFNYIPNPVRKFLVDWACAGLRVVSLPLPTRLIPAGFRASSTITGADGFIQRNTSTSCSDKGIATTHVLEYRGASSLDLFVNGAQKQHLRFKAATDYSANLHFHTVPQACPGPGHAAAMFGMLLDRIQERPSGTVTLNTNEDDPIKLGSQMPSSVDLRELDVVKDDCSAGRLGSRFGISANCAGGGAGLGCGN